jgi:hypothetical protein
MVPGNIWINQFAVVRLECTQRRDLVAAHQSAVAGNVRGEDRYKPSFDIAFAHHRTALALVDKI